ncbi:hypothetical protein [Parablautia intestinalis]|uniref:hypothetical protein n=1 Tax=Parablautia intestinalis TaxID=2320100 RepID=UPI00256ED15D|nr:hypothetical protein [Parablautia intestinalis]
MSMDALTVIAQSMEEMDINYAFMEWSEEPSYPYFVGEYQEVPSGGESGEQELNFILTGFARGEGAWIKLEEEKKEIKKHFPPVGGKVVITDSGSAVAVFYANSLPIPQDEMELKKIQINLTVKEWSVEE